MERVNQQVPRKDSRLPRSTCCFVRRSYFTKHFTCSHFMLTFGVWLIPLLALQPSLSENLALGAGRGVGNSLLSHRSAMQKGRSSQWPMPVAILMKDGTSNHQDDLREPLDSKLMLLNPRLGWLAFRVCRLEIVPGFLGCTGWHQRPPENKDRVKHPPRMSPREHKRHKTANNTNEIWKTTPASPHRCSLIRSGNKQGKKLGMEG